MKKFVDKSHIDDDNLRQMIAIHVLEITHIKHNLKEQEFKMDKIISALEGKVDKKELLILCGAWVITILSLIVLAFFAKYIDIKARVVIETVTSWLTVASIIYFGVIASKKIHKKDNYLGILVGVAFASILTCYLGYVLIDYGSVWMHISAIGFNLATFLQCFAAYKIIKHCVAHKE